MYVQLGGIYPASDGDVYICPCLSGIKVTDVEAVLIKPGKRSSLRPFDVITDRSAVEVCRAKRGARCSKMTPSLHTAQE